MICKFLQLFTMDDMTTTGLKSRVEQAFSKRKHFFLAQQDHLTLRRVRSIIEEDINVQAGKLDEIKHVVKDLVDGMLTADAKVGGSSQLFAFDCSENGFLIHNFLSVNRRLPTPATVYCQ